MMAVVTCLLLVNALFVAAQRAGCVAKVSAEGSGKVSGVGKAHAAAYFFNRHIGSDQ